MRERGRGEVNASVCDLFDGVTCIGRGVLYEEVLQPLSLRFAQPASKITTVTRFGCKQATGLFA